MRKQKILLILCVLMGASGQADVAAKRTYAIEELVRVLTPVSFQCKLADYEASPAVRFTVQLRNIEAEADSSEQKSILADILEKPGVLELRNVRFRNYFRIEADLWVDGKDVTPVLLASGWKSSSPPTTSDETPVSATITKRRHLNVGTPEDRAVVRSRSFKRKVSIQQLLDTRVDCSSLTSETSFAEAVEVLRDSTDPPLPLLVLWRDLEANAFIGKDTLIGADGFGRMKLGQALNLVLRAISVGGEKPVMVFEGGILTLGTRQTLMKKQKARVYSIEDLLQAPSNADEYQMSQQGQGNGFR